MRRVAILTDSIIEFDAVSNDIFGMKAALEGAGHEVALFARKTTLKESGIRKPAELHRYLRGVGAVLLYHHSIGWDDGLTILRETPCPRVVKYHNVTPPEFFDDLSRDYLHACRIGREELAAVAGAGCDRYLFDSEYNMEELFAVGADRSRSTVVHPFHRTESLQTAEGDPCLLDAYRDGKANFLTVGRLAPNKGHLLLITAFAIYYHEYNPQSRLFIVGKEDPALGSYTGYLRGLAAGFGIEQAVVFTGQATDKELKTYYLLADVLLALSDHEGFCIPLVEAMALKVPIVARAAAAIPGTVGDAALAWPERDPDLIAESIDYVVREQQARHRLTDLGYQRFRRLFTTERIRAQFHEALDGIL
jgi:glycosyltransferase involved in cell wall biosynthesis